MTTECNAPDYEQLPSELLDYTINFARLLAEGEGIASLVWTIEAGIGVVGTGAHAPTFDGTFGRGWLSDVELGEDVVFQCTITTDATPPREIADSWIIRPVLVRTRA